jgi:hypothetical protein
MAAMSIHRSLSLISTASNNNAIAQDDDGDDSDTSFLGRAAMSIRRSLSSILSMIFSLISTILSNNTITQDDGDDNSLTTTTGSKKKEAQDDQANNNNNDDVNNNDDDDEVVTISYSLPRTLILNASFDMGLQENGKLMADAMAQHTTVEYKHISWTDHASICWNEKTFCAMREFMALA